MRLLVTGFEPWGRVRRNPSGDLARAVGGHVLPVDFARAERELLRRIRASRPEAILMVGLAAARTRISLETVALNLDHCEEGKGRRWRRPIRRGGPLALESTLPVDRLLRALRKARLPVSLSAHAGTFVCNHVFYVALADARVPAGFLHVPPVRAVPFETQLRAVRVILAALEVSASG